MILATSSLEASTCRLRTGEKAAAWERSSPQDLERKTVKKKKGDSKKRQTDRED